MTIARVRAGLAVVGLALAAGACGGDAGRAGYVEVGRRMPAYAAPTLAGDTLELESLRGKVVLLNVWATWCPPCRDEMPGLQQLHQELAGRGLRVVGVSIDGRGALPEVRSFLQEYGIDFTILHDPELSVLKLLRSSGVPETLLVDRRGRVLQRWIGRIDPAAPQVRQPILDALSS